MKKTKGEFAGQDTEVKILLAAEQEFIGKGFAGARTTLIAEAAGVNHAMLHYYFRTKENLFDRIINDKISLLKELLTHTVSDVNLSLNELIRNIIDTHLDFIAANPGLPRLITGVIFSDSDRSALILERINSYAPAMIAGLQFKIDCAAAKGECRKVDAAMLLLDIASLNIFAFLATPIVNAALGAPMADKATFLARRKEENYDTIIRKLRP